jgi:hypothetical protein
MISVGVSTPIPSIRRPEAGGPACARATRTGLRRPADPSTPPEDEVVVACLSYRNDDVCGQALFIGLIAYLGDGTVYA